MNSNLDYGLWLTVRQCRFISDNKYTVIMEDVDNWRSSAYVELGNISKISLSSSQFLHVPKTALKKSLFL